MNQHQEASGTIWAVFGHRLAIEGTHGRVLADLGPKGAEGLVLAPGDTVAVRGEKKPSEIKVATLTLRGTTHEIAWPEKRPHDEDLRPVDPSAALIAVREAGYVVDGDAKRKPRHVEVRGVKDGSAFELHVTPEGVIRKAKPIESSASIRRPDRGG